MKSVYNIRPNLPRYKTTWDVSIVLKYLEQCSPVKFLSRQYLTHKLVTLLALVTGQRIQTLHALDLEYCDIGKDYVNFHITTLLKHNNIHNKMNNNIILHSFNENKNLCPVFHTKYYIERTKRDRQSSKLFISTQKPFKAASKSTISRWVKTTLTRAGINTNIYKPHSTRSASTSAAAASDLDITHILKTANWSRATTFAKYYSKPITEGNGAFMKAILRKV